MLATIFLFAGLALVWQLLFSVAFVIVVAMFVWTVVLFVRAGRYERRATRAADPTQADELTWVFLVPALDEEVTIRDSVERLLAVPVRSRRIVVIDDASADATPDVLASIDHADLVVLRRELPEARRGKAAALNHAYRALAHELAGLDRSKVIVVVVDADGRLGLDAPAYAAAHFADPAVGGVQAQVRIYNRRRFLAWLQDIEFGVYGHLFQAGRNHWGTAGMGGNGQANRLSALDDVADAEGPWRHRLTEDQDLGLRLLAAGWQGRQDLGAVVDQQGLSRLRPLLRQRTRWSQGNLQAMGLAGAVRRAPFPLGARLELLAYLFMPIWQGIIGVSLVAALVLEVLGVVPFWAGGPTWELVLVYLLAFGGTMLGCVASRRGQGLRGFVVGLLLGHVYSLYTWLIWPVLVRSTARHLARRGSWTKTAREAISTAP